MNMTSSWLALGLGLALLQPFLEVTAQPADPGWPRVFKKDKKQLTVYQPQVDHWNGYTNLHFRSAIAVKGVSKEEKFGVAEVDALTVVDHGARVVAIVPVRRELRFANVPESEQAKLRQAVEELHPSGQATTLSLDRVLAYLDPATQPVQPAVEVNMDPPTIFSSTTPAILVMFMGEPQFKPVEPERTDLLFALNTNWDVLYDAASRNYYLLHGEGWLTTVDVLKGAWVPAVNLPPSMYSLPATENWTEARQRLPGRPAKVAPAVFVTTEPAELILLDGPPSYMPVQGTKLLRVNNTDSVLFLHTGDGKLYYLVAGRWFRGGHLTGPWSSASTDLPPDFAQIPANDPSAFVKASVPGTREAQDAVLLASIPSTTTVQVAPVTEVVTYTGTPQFVSIPSTTVQYAVNTPAQVFLVSGAYYWCYGGAWLQATSPNGPWTYCTSVPPAIYTIPPSNPNYNVTYVTVQSTTPSTVVYSQTSGYSGEYVAATGVVMFGMGMLVGAAIADHDHYYCYPPPCHYSYGCGAVYHYGGGGFYGSGYACYGPYGGAGRTAAYNPSTGTYARSSYAYGPYGSAARGSAYNPYTGTSAAGRSISTPYGNARQGAAYNPYTGARAAGGQVNTAYGSAGRGAAYNPTTGRGAAGGYATGAYGSAGAVRTSEGSGMVAWDTESGQGAVGKSQSGDYYAAKDGTVYKKDSDGGWSQNSGSGWESASKPQPASASPQAASTSASSSSANRQAQAGATSQTRATTTSTATQGSTAPSGNRNQNVSSMDSQAQARSWGNQQHQSSQSWQSTGGSRSAGGATGARTAGGGGRRR
jgi:hypothetical protein